jgi:hypothetical protein
MKISIQITDDNDEVVLQSEAQTVDSAIQDLGRMERALKKISQDLEVEAFENEREKNEMVFANNPSL